MNMAITENPADFVPITGAGVEALDRRHENNGDKQTSIADLRASIEKTKGSIFAGIKMLTEAAVERAR
jgi:hypothetical protein